MRAVFQRVLSAQVSVCKKIEVTEVPPAPPTIDPSQAIEKSNNSGDSNNSSSKQNQIAPSFETVQEIIGEIEHGILIFVGIGRDDTEADVSYLVDRALNLRIFSDNNDQMNLSLLDVHGAVLVVSQFTLYGDTRKGRRPSFFEAMDPNEARGLYLSFCKQLEKAGVQLATGEFGAKMQVSLVNDGPVTLLIDTKK